MFEAVLCVGVIIGVIAFFKAMIDEANEVHEWTIEMIKEVKKEGRD